MFDHSLIPFCGYAGHARCHRAVSIPENVNVWMHFAGQGFKVVPVLPIGPVSPTDRRTENELGRRIHSSQSAENRVHQTSMGDAGQTGSTSAPPGIVHADA